MTKQSTIIPKKVFTKKATTLADGAYDCALIGEVDGKNVCIAEFFGRVSEDHYMDAGKIANTFATAYNTRDALISTLKEADYLANENDLDLRERETRLINWKIQCKALLDSEEKNS